MLPAIKYLLESFEGDTLLSAYGKDLDDLSDICGLITDAIDEEAPLTVREGKMIKSGYNEEIDRLRLASTDGKKWMADLLEEEKERSGIKNLRIKYDQVLYRPGAGGLDAQADIGKCGTLYDAEA